MDLLARVEFDFGFHFVLDVVVVVVPLLVVGNCMAPRGLSVADAYRDIARISIGCSRSCSQSCQHNIVFLPAQGVPTALLPAGFAQLQTAQQGFLHLEEEKSRYHRIVRNDPGQAEEHPSWDLAEVQRGWLNCKPDLKNCVAYALAAQGGMCKLEHRVACLGCHGQGYLVLCGGFFLSV